MNERGQQEIWLAPIGVLVVLAVVGLLLGLGPALGGTLGELHYAVRDLVSGTDRVIIDQIAPRRDLRPQGGGLALTPEMPDVPRPLELSPAPSPTPGAPCASFAFEGALSIREGRLSFGRFNLVSDTEPYGQSDPLSAWKLIQFESLELGEMSAQDWQATGSNRVIVIPVDQTVRMLISDPFTEEMLFSASWRIAGIEVHGRQASVNAELETNLADIRVNNPVQSPTLDSFSDVRAGILTLRFEHTRDLVPALRGNEPVYAPMSGTIEADACVR